MIHGFALGLLGGGGGGLCFTGVEGEAVDDSGVVDTFVGIDKGEGRAGYVARRTGRSKKATGVAGGLKAGF